MRTLVFLALILIGRTTPAAEATLRSYVDGPFTAEVTRVEVKASAIHVEGRALSSGEELFLVELPVWESAVGETSVPFSLPLTPDAQGTFEVDVERKAESANQWLSRWAVATRVNDKFQLLSHARYADVVASLREIPEERPRNRKGLGAFAPSRPVEDIDQLDVSAVTVNVLLNNLLWLEPGEQRTPHEFGGQTWHVDDRAIKRLDRTMLDAAAKKLVVSAILLVPQKDSFPDQEMGRRMTHPDADPEGTYVMPNVTTAEGALAYAAALDLLAERYSRPDGEFGRIHHWIMHNEVNSGWVWTNAGEKSLLEYVDLYHKSMRLMHLIARQYDANAKVFVSLDHHWTTRHNDHCFRARGLLQVLLKFTKAEGDFDWAIAHHPYPQDLGNPQVWKNDQVTFSFDTPKITFKNLEVLDAWVKRPESMYLGEKVRTVHLTEQGLNSPDYSEESLRNQAAGMAYAWNKMKPLETIEMFHYHNWVDNRGEGGLRIGLRKFPDDADDPNGKKPIWNVYKALGTELEEQATTFAKAVIGISDWSEVTYKGQVTDEARE